jgi:hypothetical protein
LLNVQYQGGSTDISVPHEDLDHVSCHLYAREMDRDRLPEGDKPITVLKPFSFGLDDGEVNFEDPVGPWFLRGRQVEIFGCL